MADILGKIGGINRHLGNYPEALKNYLSSLKIYRELGDKVDVVTAYWQIGNLYGFNGNYPEALESYFKMLKLTEELDDKNGVAIAYINIGFIYLRQEEYDKALEKFTNALEIFKDEGVDEGGIAKSYFNIGDVHRLRGNYVEALENHFAALEIYKKEGNIRGIVSSYNSIADTYRKLNRPKEAKKYVEKILEIDTKHKDIEQISSTYQLISNIESDLGNYKESLENYKMYIKYKDSLFNEENTRKITQTEMNFEFDKKQDSVRLANEKEIAIRDATLQANQRQKWFYFAGLLFLGTIGSLLFYQNRLRKKRNHELDEANRIKTRFFSILNHDLRSPVSSLIHFLHLKKENSELLDEDEKNALEQESVQEVENLLVTMEDLLLWSKGQMENFKPQPKKITVNQLFEDTKKVFSGYQNIQFEYHNPENLEIFTDENYLKTIIRNLTSNAINAFTSTQKPYIAWKAFHEQGKTILSITDNGPGASEEAFKALYDDKEVVGIKTGLGLHLIRDLAKAINCEIEVNSEKGKGTRFDLKI